MGKKSIIIIVIVAVILLALCVCCGVGIFLYQTGDDLFGLRPNIPGLQEGDEETEEEEIVEEEATATAEQVVVDPSEQTWLVMLYEDADDEILERDLAFDVNESESVGSSDRVTIVAQFDRAYGSYDGEGDWTTTRRYLLNADSDLNNLNSQMVQDLGEVDMGDPNTLVDFVVWAVNTYPATNYILVLSDHGAGWYGGYTDMDNGNDEGIYMNQMDDAFAQMMNLTGIGKFDIIAFDACLMGQLEVFTAIAPYALYGVASEEVIPAIGYAYAGWLRPLVNDPGMSAAQAATQMVNSYIYEDLRITDEDARRDFLAESFNYYDEVSADELGVEMASDVTLSAVDLSLLPAVNQALNDLTTAMTGIEQSYVAQARTYAQGYYSIFGPDVPASYIDLANFAALVSSQSGDATVTSAANALISAIDQAVIAEMHGPDLPGSTGMSIYFPNSALYVSDYGGYGIYTEVANRFATESQWDDFLAYHYTGSGYVEGNQGAVVPDPGFVLNPPGTGDIGIYPISAIPSTVSVGQSVNLTTTIYGSNIAYIYFFSGRYYPETGELLAIDADFMESEQTQEVEGVYFPYWGDGSINIDMDWQPAIYYISDGYINAFAVLYPLNYGASDAETTYVVDGNYTFADSGKTIYAVMIFGLDGYLRNVYSYSREGGPDSAREIYPRAGDTFTLLLKSIDMSDPNNPQFSEFWGDTLTFGNQTFYWDSYQADPGQYVAGFAVLDFDGNWVMDYAQVEVIQ